MRTFILFLFLTVAVGANAQFVQQGDKLVGTGAVNPAVQGLSVSLSSDGNTAIVGGVLDNNEAGAAWVFTRTGGVWSQQGSKLVGTGAVGNAQQGTSVCLSSDGNTAIVGGVTDNSNEGAAWVFTRTGGVWSQQGNKLVGTGAVGNAHQGNSVSISSDGNTAILGGPGDNGLVGAAWVFTRTGGVWSQQGNKLVGTGAVGIVFQGHSVSLSSIGNTAIVGGLNDNSGVGAAWVFTRTGGMWSQQGSKLVGTVAVGNAQQGISVSLSSDGNTAIVGGSEDNSNVGAAWVFTHTGSVWSQQGNKLVGTGVVGVTEQGWSVSLSSDGNMAIVGGPRDNSSVGAAWVFTRTGGVWSQKGNKLVGTGGVGVTEQGTSVSLSSDGNTAIVGGIADNDDAGASWVFVRPGSPAILSVNEGWNMTSLPLTMLDYTKTSLFPTAVSDAFAYEGSYVVKSVLENGDGYWLRFGSTEDVLLSGFIRDLDTFTVASGWNMIGSISTPVDVTTITSIPGGIVTSQFFGYNGAYVTTSTIEPGKGYWVRTTQAGELILAATAPEAGQIQIIPTQEMPPTPPVPTAAGEEDGLPTEFALHQNYPNPFNPSTTIEYAIPERAIVEIKVLDVLGREVATLLNDEKPAGAYAVRWDADGVASGVYFYRLTAGSFVQTRRMVLMR